MVSKVESEVHGFTLELEKFAARWHQLKPGAELLEGDRAAAASALVSLKERRAEFNELLKSANQLRWGRGCNSSGL